MGKQTQISVFMNNSNHNTHKRVPMSSVHWSCNIKDLDNHILLKLGQSTHSHPHRPQRRRSARAPQTRMQRHGHGQSPAAVDGRAKPALEEFQLGQRHGGAEVFDSSRSGFEVYVVHQGKGVEVYANAAMLCHHDFDDVVVLVHEHVAPHEVDALAVGGERDHFFVC